MGESDHELFIFIIHHKAGKSVSNAEVLSFRKADFDRLKRLVVEALMDHDLTGRGVQGEWSLLKGVILEAQGMSIPSRRKGSKRAQ